MFDFYKVFYLISSLHGDDEDNVDIDTYIDGDSQSLRESLQWEAASNASSPTDSTSTTNSKSQFHFSYRRVGYLLLTSHYIVVKITTIWKSRVKMAIFFKYSVQVKECGINILNVMETHMQVIHEWQGSIHYMLSALSVP